MPYARGILNPLVCHALDAAHAKVFGLEPSVEAVLEFHCVPGCAPTLDELRRRYDEITRVQAPLFFVPSEASVLRRMVFPLRHAKADYIVENYVGTIALCGLVAEMATLLTWEIAEPAQRVPLLRNGIAVDFEKLGQRERIGHLENRKVIDEATAAKYRDILGVRRQFVHFWEHKEGTSPRASALRCFGLAVQLVSDLIGQGIDEGKWVPNPRLIDFLKRSDLWTDTPAE